MDAHEAGGLWLLREMWDFPSGVPEDEQALKRRRIDLVFGSDIPYQDPAS